MGTGPVTPVTWSSQLADKLDEADGVKDGKITASIWNNFMAGTGSNGNRINRYITLDRAIVSFNYYKNKKDIGQVDWSDADKLLTDVSAKPGEKITMDVAKQDTTPPAGTVTIPTTTVPVATDTSLTTDLTWGVQDVSNAGKEVNKGTYTYVYNDKGWVTEIKDSASGNLLKEIYRKDDGSLDDSDGYSYDEYTYDKSGNLLKVIYRKEDGSLRNKDDGIAYTENLYNADNKITDYIQSYIDGSVSNFQKYNYDTDGNSTVTYYNSDGSIDGSDGYAYTSNIYGSDGKVTRRIYRKADGSLRDPADGCAYIDYEYDADGKKIRETKYNNIGEVYVDPPST